MNKTLFALSLLSFLSACAGVAQKSQEVGPAGSVITISEGLTLSIPAGALPANTALTVRDTNFAPGEHELEFEPRGLALKSPATLTLTEDDGVSELHLDVLGHVSLRREDSSTHHTRKSCKWVLVSYDPATGTSVWTCSYARP